MEDEPKSGLLFFSSLKAVTVEQQEASHERPKELALTFFFLIKLSDKTNSLSVFGALYIGIITSVPKMHRAGLAHSE